MKAKFCSQCGRAAESRTVDGRLREVCTGCGTIFYRNPLPVAAGVLLNPEREVLLIKRKHDPRKGLWCLPMGFAELDETIAHAATRELEEEAGIQGKVMRLLSAESMTAKPYGDLLVITFEMEKTGGEELAGDDAEEVAYFAVDRLPPLAFAANQHAIRTCLRTHREQWAIQDSFQHLSENRQESMLSDALVAFTSKHARQISEAWLREVLSHPTTPSYARMERRPLLERAAGALSQFSRWLSGTEDQREVIRFYRQLGAERRRLGFELSEVISSLTLLRRQVVDYALQHGVWRDALDAYTVLELDHRIILFFDQALYHTVLGYANDSP